MWLLISTDYTSSGNGWYRGWYLHLPCAHFGRNFLCEGKGYGGSMDKRNEWLNQSAIVIIRITSHSLGGAEFSITCGRRWPLSSLPLAHKRLVHTSLNRQVNDDYWNDHKSINPWITFKTFCISSPFMTDYNNTAMCMSAESSQHDMKQMCHQKCQFLWPHDVYTSTIFDVHGSVGSKYQRSQSFCDFFFWHSLPPMSSNYLCIVPLPGTKRATTDIFNVNP